LHFLLLTASPSFYFLSLGASSKRREKIKSQKFFSAQGVMYSSASERRGLLINIRAVFILNDKRFFLKFPERMKTMERERDFSTVSYICRCERFVMWGKMDFKRKKQATVRENNVNETHSGRGKTLEI
jgi:hypothetical protein